MDNIHSGDGQLQYKAYSYPKSRTKEPADWAYEAWDELLAGLTHKDNHVRVISAQLLANLATSNCHRYWVESTRSVDAGWSYLKQRLAHQAEGAGRAPSGRSLGCVW